MSQLQIKVKSRHPLPFTHLSPPHSLLFMGQEVGTEIREQPGSQSGQQRDQKLKQATVTISITAPR